MRIDKSKIASAVERFEQFVKQGLAAEWFPGVSVAFVVAGETVHNAGYGWADPEAQKPATADTVYRAASISKLFTAVAALQLVEQGALDLDAPIEQALPWFRIINPFENSGPITIRQLLCHRSGMVRESPVGGYFDAGYFSDEACVRSVAGCVLVNPPNTQTRYSNVGPTIIGCAIARQTRLSFIDYQQKYLFEPLGMTSSAWLLNDAIERRMARGTMRYNCGDGTYGMRMAPVFELGTLPAGSLRTTTGDLAKFASFVMSGSNGAKELTPPILRAETLAQMTQLQLIPGDEGFGLGFILRLHRGHKVVRHAGQLYGFTSLWSVLPEAKIGVVILANSDEVIGRVRHLTDRAIDLLLEAVHGTPIPVAPAEVQATATELAAFTGEYESQSYWAKFDVTTDNSGTCRLTGNLSSQPLEMTQVEESKFLVSGRVMEREAFEFYRDATGNVAGFRGMLQDFRRVDPDACSEPPEVWQTFVGSYGPDFIPVVISIRNGNLYASLENEFEYRLRPVNRVTFLLPPGMYSDEQVVFQMDERGNVNSLIMASMHFSRNTSVGRD